MKKFMFWAMALAVALVSCQKAETPKAPEITADALEIQIPAEGTEEEPFYITFNSPVDWTATVGADAKDWLTITPAKGSAGEASVKVIALSNTESPQERTATVTVTASTAKAEFKLTQLGRNEFTFVDEDQETEIDEKGGTIEIKVMTNVEFETEVYEGSDWLHIATSTKAYGEQTLTVTVDPYTEYDGERTGEIKFTVSGDCIPDGITYYSITQSGPSSLVWKSAVKDVTGFVPGNGARLAMWGDYLLLANGTKVLALDPATGNVQQTIDLPDGYKAQSLCVDDAGNVLAAANAAWASENADIFRIYTVSSLNDAPTCLIEYNAGNIWCSHMCNVRVKGNIKQGNAVITAYASYSAYWMAWNVVDGKVGDLSCAVTPYTSNTNSGCVYPAGTSLSDGLWFIGYGGDYNLRYCASPSKESTATNWTVAYTTGSTWMENYDCISTAKLSGKEYMAILASCHFNYDSPNLFVLDVTDRANVAKVKDYDFWGHANWVDNVNKDWTDGENSLGTNTFADVCLVANGDVLKAYYIDVNYGTMGCVIVPIAAEK